MLGLKMNNKKIADEISKLLEDYEKREKELVSLLPNACITYIHPFTQETLIRKEDFELFENVSYQRMNLRMDLINAHTLAEVINETPTKVNFLKIFQKHIRKYIIDRWKVFPRTAEVNFREYRWGEFYPQKEPEENHLILKIPKVVHSESYEEEDL
jgi:hypothetical protein